MSCDIIQSFNTSSSIGLSFLLPPCYIYITMTLEQTKSTYVHSPKSHVENHQLLKQSIQYPLLQSFTDISFCLLNPFGSTKAKVISFASIFTVQNIFPSNSYSIFTLYPHSKPILDIYPFITKSNLIISSNIIPLLLYIAFCHLHFHLFTKTTLCL